MRFVCQAFSAWHQDKRSHITKVTDSHCSVGSDIDQPLERDRDASCLVKVFFFFFVSVN